MSIQSAISPVPRRALPEQGNGWGQLKGIMRDYAQDDVDWRRGRSPLYVFFADPEVLEVAREAYAMFMSENALGPAAFPSLKRMESEVVEMSLDLLHAPEGAAGSMTSGGTESIFLAVKAARDWARAERPEITEPELLLPYSAHPAFNKAAHYLGVKARRVQLRADFTADPAAMAEGVTASTIMMVGSAVAYPQGVFDPIEALAAVAQERGLWMHVDACVGGYTAPFVAKLGYPVPAFDLGVPGVCSLSADLHKYGFAAKGASTILYAEERRHAFQFYEFTDWPKGLYRTPSFAGTRPGGAVAAAWAVLNHLGMDGYLRLNRQLMEMRDAYIAGIEAIPELRIWGKPGIGIVTFGSNVLNIFAVAERMAQRGWYPNVVAKPQAIHLMLSLAHEPARGEYLEDLAACVNDVMELGGHIESSIRPVTY
ncbi:aminotransferase class V-fold PLP-dependent enzyme [Pelagibius sp.]|uniref:pyridoxal phosphate-dependent decarboxylase family protein n=1 Tax=Pelagibius sp. TaxID=1931238 RepID=UPI002605D8AA|nr:aminotransferase class V-fold PLP-dependent enzyme [Pelagibius sp.]